VRDGALVEQRLPHELWTGPVAPVPPRCDLRGQDPVKDANPGDCLTTYNLVVNLKTVKQLAITIPWFILYRADEVIR
jgi:hypothetical protein